jgi:hypothetical protein
MRDRSCPPGHLWWLSFVNDSLPDPFLGTVVLQARTLKGALSLAGILGVNPGGAVQAYAVNPARDPDLYGRTPHGKLLTRDDLIAIGHTWAEMSTRKFLGRAGPQTWGEG